MGAERQYVRTCTNPECQHEHIGERVELLRLFACEQCGKPLPNNVTIWRGHTESTAAASQSGAPEHGDTRGNDKPAGPFSRSAPFDPFAAGAVDAFADDSSADGAAAMASPEAATASGRMLVLIYRDGDVVVPLTQYEGDGFIGREFAASTALEQMSTVSRRQFRYRYVGDGVVEIINMSRFGTVVSGTLLSSDPAAGAPDRTTVRAGAVVIMGGHTFDLKEMGT